MSSTEGMITLVELESAARGMGMRADVVNTGGGVMALSLTIGRHDYLIALDYGQPEGTGWSIATDGDTREIHGEIECDDIAVTSDADQTIRDAIAWAAWVMEGGDHDGPLHHGERVQYPSSTDLGTVVGESYVTPAGDHCIGVHWDDAPDYVSAEHIGHVRRLPLGFTED